MPATMLGTHDLGTALAAYRMCLSLSLARGSGPFAPLPDPVLAGFPHLLADHHVLAEFLTKWRDITTKMTAILDVGVGDRGAGTEGAGGGALGVPMDVRAGVFSADRGRDGGRGTGLRG